MCIHKVSTSKFSLSEARGQSSHQAPRLQITRLTNFVHETSGRAANSHLLNYSHLYMDKSSIYTYAYAYIHICIYTGLCNNIKKGLNGGKQPSSQKHKARRYHQSYANAQCCPPERSTEVRKCIFNSMLHTSGEDQPETSLQCFVHKFLCSFLFPRRAIHHRRHLHRLNYLPNNRTTSRKSYIKHPKVCFLHDSHIYAREYASLPRMHSHSLNLLEAS
jgi:hypothetical protein